MGKIFCHRSLLSPSATSPKCSLLELIFVFFCLRAAAMPAAKEARRETLIYPGCAAVSARVLTTTTQVLVEAPGTTTVSHTFCPDYEA